MPILRYKKYLYDFQRGQGPGDIRNLTVEIVVDWFNKTFPSLPDHLARQRKADYCEAIFKFTDFLYFELELWPQDQRDLLKKKVKRPYSSPTWENKVEIVEIEKLDALLEFIKPVSRIHHMMFYLMRHCGMRYLEVINARTDLRTGTLIQDFAHDMVGKGQGRPGTDQNHAIPPRTPAGTPGLHPMARRERQKLRMAVHQPVR